MKHKASQEQETTGLDNTRAVHTSMAMTAVGKRITTNTKACPEETNRLRRRDQTGEGLGEPGLGVRRLKRQRRRQWWARDAFPPARGGTRRHWLRPAWKQQGLTGSGTREVPRSRSRPTGPHMTDVRCGVTVSHPPNGGCDRVFCSFMQPVPSGPGPEP